MKAEILQKLIDKFGKDAHIRARKIPNRDDRIEIDSDVSHKELFQFMRREGFKEFYKDGIHKFWNDEGVKIHMGVMSNTAWLVKESNVVEKIDLLLGEMDGIANPGTTTADIAKTPEKNVLGLRKRRKKRLELVKTTGNAAISAI